jgi:hypothetical protein
MTTSPRHSWGAPESFPLARKTECECKKCGLVRVKRRDGEGPRDKYWTEWFRGLDKIESRNTPACISGSLEDVRRVA